ncbi:hypothetical protein JHV675_42830 [Mycobacterium avium subsp. hominissuis]
MRSQFVCVRLPPVPMTVDTFDIFEAVTNTKKPGSGAPGFLDHHSHGRQVSDLTITTISNDGVPKKNGPGDLVLTHSRGYDDDATPPN